MIQVKGLIKNYGNFRAVDNVSFDVKPGEVFGFLGPNGAGENPHAHDRGLVVAVRRANHH